MSGIKGQVQKKGHVTWRHDGFTPKKRRRFCKTLRKTGCISDAARRAGVSTTTISRWRRRDTRFAKACERALEIAAVDLDALAYDRAVHGCEEQVIRDGKVVEIRKKPSDSIFRLLLMASNRKKYGRMGAVDRKRIERKLRKKIDKEQRRLGGQRVPRTADELRASILEKLDAMHARLHGKVAKDGRGPPDGAGESLNRPEE